MWKESHPLPYQSKLKERFLGPLSFSDTIWVGLGAFLSLQLSKVWEPIPLIGFPYDRLHYFIPLFITSFFAFTKHQRTGLPLWKYMFVLFKFRLRKRKYLYRRSNIVEGGDRY